MALQKDDLKLLVPHQQPAHHSSDAGAGWASRTPGYGEIDRMEHHGGYDTLGAAGAVEQGRPAQGRSGADRHRGAATRRGARAAALAY